MMAAEHLEALLVVLNRLAMSLKNNASSLLTHTFDDLFRINDNDHYLSGWRLATQSCGTASQIMLCPDICPCISNSLFLTLE